jgi:hypothetical protein
MKAFWMIWNEGNRGPTIQHFTIKEVRKEAERLARLNPGQKFYILSAIDCCRMNDISWASEEVL